jgi:hypothetical protein
LVRRALELTSLLAWCAGLLACSGAIESPGPGANATGAGATTSTGGSVGSGGATGGTSSGGSGGAIGGTAGSGTGGAGGAGGTGGATGGAGGSAGTVDPACMGAAADTDANVLRRLSALEYQRTVQSLLQLPAPPAVDDIPADNERLGFRTFAEFQTMSSQNLRAYVAKAGDLADALLADATRRSAVIGCTLSDATCLGTFVASFGRLAYRRPLEPTEVDAITAQATEHGVDTNDQFRFAIEVLLSSPNFLYRVEVGNAPEGLSTLTSGELASRLSFALLGRGPSAALLDQAATGALDTPEGLRTAAQTMLADPEAQTFFAAFFRQWLGYNTLRAPVMPPQGWSDALMPDMQAETDAVVRDFAWGGQNLFDMLSAPYTKVSAPLAIFYGLPAPGTDGRVDVPAGHERHASGLLTHASLLGAKSDGDLIAIRGNWLRRTFLCEELAPPPDLADQIGDLLVGLTRTEIVNVRNTTPECRGCHAMIDPIGVGFAKFDASGRYVASLDLSGFTIGAALSDAPEPAGFAAISELSTKLQALPMVPACATDRAFLYVNGREPAAADHCTVEGVARTFVSGGQTFPGLLAALVETPSFRLRRAPAPTP